jgi:hypothetical protein
MGISNREKRQYLDDLYVTFLGSYLKNGHSQDPEVILKVTELHWKALMKKMEVLNIHEDEI